jgi:hypothetical protein
MGSSKLKGARSRDGRETYRGRSRFDGSLRLWSSWSGSLRDGWGNLRSRGRSRSRRFGGRGGLVLLPIELVGRRGLHTSREWYVSLCAFSSHSWTCAKDVLQANASKLRDERVIDPYFLGCLQSQCPIQSNPDFRQCPIAYAYVI